MSTELYDKYLKANVAKILSDEVIKHAEPEEPLVFALYLPFPHEFKFWIKDGTLYHISDPKHLHPSMIEHNYIQTKQHWTPDGFIFPSKYNERTDIIHVPAYFVREKYANKYVLDNVRSQTDIISKENRPGETFEGYNIFVISREFKDYGIIDIGICATRAEPDPRSRKVLNI